MKKNDFTLLTKDVWRMGMVVLLAVIISAGMQTAVADETNYEESKVSSYKLPDPFVCYDGRQVKNSKMWRDVRRPELLAAFTTNMYGRVPELPLQMRFETREVNKGAFNGLATRKQITIHLFKEEDSPKIDLLLYLPNKTTKPVPVFMRLSYGNQGISSDPDVIPSRNTKSEVGQYVARWPLEMILNRGYAVATFAGADVEQDRHGSGTTCKPGAWREGVRGYALEKAGREEPLADEWGTLAAWAWAMSRALDCLEHEQAVDSKKVIALGHSRTGKTALWAAAQDERFAIAISNNSGEGGAALTRRNFGETIKTLPKIWVASKYKSFAGREDELPFDQHLLIALIAPRPVYVASATDDKWSDPHGEFLSAFHADPVYRMFGLKGLDVNKMPQPDTSVGDTLGYHIRTGKHDITPFDWKCYLDFADCHLR